MCLPTILLTLVLASAPVFAGAPSSNFDDGSSQGWLKREPFGGTLSNPGTGGNTGGFLLATDNVSTGGGLFVVAPASFTGDLSAFLGFQWDEFVYIRGAGGSRTVKATDLFITGGANGTTFRLASNPLTVMGHWHGRFVEFKPTAFVLAEGSDSFEAVMRNVTELAFQLDTSTMADGGPESAVDNVRLVATPVFLGIAALADEQLAMEWRGEAGFSYRVESSGNPAADWQTVTTLIAGSDGRIFYQCPRPGGVRSAYYRLAYP